MKLKNVLGISLAIAFCLTGFAGCGTDDENGGGTDGSEISYVYTDTIERPEIDMPTAAAQVSYPAKPDTAPSAPSEGTTPSVSGYTASSADSTYTLEQQPDGSMRINYSDVTDWAYVYMPVQDYSSEYPNVKISINNAPSGETKDSVTAERIAVQAVYYESYDLGYYPVTVYLGELSVGEQYVIFSLGDYLISDGSFNKISGEYLKDQTIIGFVVFIDSLPCYAPAYDASGMLDITDVKFLQDGDAELDDKYVSPVADLSSATGGTYHEETQTLSVSGGSAYIPVEKYSADYTEFVFTAEGEGSVSTALQYEMDGGTYLSQEQTFSFGADGTVLVDYDFTDMRPSSGGADLISQYIKNADVTAIVVIAESAVTVSGVSFVRTAVDGAYVAANWTSAASDVSIDRTAAGGNAKLTYSYYTSWSYVSVPIRNGTNVERIEISLYCPDGINHLGVGISTSSPYNSSGQNAGSFILRGSAALLDGNDTEVQGSIVADSAMYGIVESYIYSETESIYKLIFDFSNMAEDAAGKTLADYTLSSFIFYLNCSCGGDAAAAHKFDGTHSVYFLSIDFMTK